MRKLNRVLATGLLAAAGSAAMLAAPALAQNANAPADSRNSPAMTPKAQQNTASPTPSGRAPASSAANATQEKNTTPRGQAAAQPAPATNPASVPEKQAGQTTPQQGTADHAQKQGMNDTNQPTRHATLSRKRVERVQTALDNSGANIPVDGIWGRQTQDALKQFQQTHGLKATGHLNHATWKELPKVG